jgi:uncharacterized protein
MSESYLGISDDDISSFFSYLKKLDSSQKAPRLYTELKEIKRLGNYFEELIFFWLNNMPSCHKVEHRVTVTQTQVTLGEFDFLFFSDLLKKCIHWEVCVKYYLLNGDEQNLASYKGLSLDDTLEHKISKLKKQLAFSKTKGAHLFLSQHQLLPVEAACLFKGYILYPFLETGQLDKRKAPEIADNHLFGYWDTFESKKWKTHLEMLPPDTRFLVLERHEMLATRLYCEDDKNFLARSCVRADLQHVKNGFLKSKGFGHTPLLLAAFIVKDGYWQELERGMLIQAPAHIST